MTVDEKDFFREATLRICGSLDIEKALQDCFQYIRDHIPISRIQFHVYHRKVGVIETVAAAPFDPHVICPFRTQLTDEGRQRVMDQRSRRIRQINCLGEDPVTRAISYKLNSSHLSGVVMDMVLEWKMLGVLSIFNSGNEPFTDEHIHLLSLLSKPCAIALTNSIRFQELTQLKDMLTDDNRYFQNELRRMAGEDVVGAHTGLKEVMEMVQQVSPMESPVLLLGETGTGKEVIANAIHDLSHRSDGPFIRVNCGAIPATLIDSELFGYEKGAFTGAVSQRRGRIERAHGGTLFLDEIGELPPEAQIRLLRVLQEHEIDRVGGNQTIRVNIRVIAATHRNLEAMMEQGEFRADLFFRLRVFPITIPPLRERKHDLPDLIGHFILRKCEEMKRLVVPSPAPEVMERLMAYHWPGNIRELENAVERSLILDRGKTLHFKEINEKAEPKQPTSALQPSEIPALDEVMAQHIRSVLEFCNGRVEGEKGAARILNIHPSTLRKRMLKLNIAFGKRSNSHQ